MQLSIPSFTLGSPTLYKIIATTEDGPIEVDKRYNDFCELAAAFLLEMDEPVPIPPPSKRWFGNSDARVCEERRQDLELMMRALVRNPEYLRSLAVQEFLGLARRAPTRSADWLQLSRRVEQALHAAKLAQAASDRRRLTLEAKGYLAQLQRQLGDVGAGERARRLAMVEGYQTAVGRLEGAAARGARGAHSAPAPPAAAPSPASAPYASTRILGETETTRKLNNTQLYDHQKHAMLEQDRHLEQLRAAIARQKGLGLAIDDELSKQNALLEQLDAQVHAVNAKVNQAKRKTSRLN